MQDRKTFNFKNILDKLTNATVDLVCMFSYKYFNGEVPVHWMDDRKDVFQSYVFVGDYFLSIEDIYTALRLNVPVEKFKDRYDNRNNPLTEHRLDLETYIQET